MVANTQKNVLKRGFLKEIKATLEQDVMILLLTTFILFAIKQGATYSRIVIAWFGVIYVCVSYITRILWKQYLRKHNRQVSSMIIFTLTELLDSVVADIRNGYFSEYRVGGIVLIDEITDETEGDYIYDIIDDIQIVRYNKEVILNKILHGWVDEVMINLPVDVNMPDMMMTELSDMGITVHMRVRVPGELRDQKYMINKVGGHNVISTSSSYMSVGQVAAKRTIDIIGGLVGSLITIILTIFLAPAIYIASPGPIFFSQTRIGKNGKKFKIYKFRSMYMDAEERKASLLEENKVSDGMMFKLEYDPRIIGCKKLPDGTIKKGIGNRIRDWSLDEFPQFFNVLKGDMSLVGTRPPTVDEWEKYSSYHRGRMAIKPGITGMWQVSGRSNITDFEEVVSLDRQYINNWSLGNDIRILFRTVLVVIRGEGAM
jgi:exopolysaccharide biosynthesis polyprenyl glycosylphosphotransferase